MELQKETQRLRLQVCEGAGLISKVIISNSKVIGFLEAAVATRWESVWTAVHRTGSSQSELIECRRCVPTALGAGCG